MIPNFDNKYFLIFANCIPVKGAKESVICDIQMGRYRKIPNILYDVIVESKGKTIGELKKHFNNSMDKGIESYFSFLQKEGWGKIMDVIDGFTELNMDYEDSSEINNCIIDFTDSSLEFIPKILDELDEMRCQYLQFRSYQIVSYKSIQAIINLLKNTTICYSELIIPYSNEYKEKDLIDLIENESRLRKLIMYGSQNNKKVNSKSNYTGKIIYLEQTLNSCKDCGKIQKEDFAPSLNTFIEAQKFNTCLNKKISVDAEGEIRNCPSLVKSFGNIKSESLKEIVLQESFRTLWHINKDQIEICKDCEFRYICTDCRAYLSDKDDILSKPEKCNYDPYTAQWID